MESLSAKVFGKRASHLRRLLCAIFSALMLCSFSVAADEKVLSAEEEYWSLVEQDNNARGGLSKERKQLAAAIFRLENLLSKEGRLQTAERLSRLQQVVEQQAFAVEGYYVDLLRWANRRRPELVAALEQRRACLRPFMTRDVNLTHEVSELMLAVVRLVEENQGTVTVKDGYLRFSEWANQIRFEKLSAGVLARAQAFGTNREAADKCYQSLPHSSSRI